MKRNAVISAVTVAVFAAIVTAALTLGPDTNDPADATEPGTCGRQAHPRRQPPPRRPPAPARSSLVEFLDFECESCRAAYPVVEDLRTKYAGKVDFVVRYFPIPSHANAVNAAVAVEAAAQQGKFEDMYKRMYDTQTDVG